MSRPVPLPVLSPPRPLLECTACAKCCTYVGIEIDGPDRLKDATQLLWYLYHPGVSLYHDGHGTWDVIFETRCRHLQPDLRCAIYEQRPHICRQFDATACDVNRGGGQDFRRPEELLAWLERERPRIHRLLAKRFLPSVSQVAPRQAAVSPADSRGPVRQNA